MSFDPQDPKWTAYVVGELDENERSAMEDELRSSPAARRLVDELRSLTDSISKAVASEPAPGLSFEQRRTLLSSATAAAPATVGRARHSQPWGKLIFAFAAGLLVAAFCLPALQSARLANRFAGSRIVLADASSAKKQARKSAPSSAAAGEASEISADYDAPDPQNMMLGHIPQETSGRAPQALNDAEYGLIIETVTNHDRRVKDKKDLVITVAKPDHELRSKTTAAADDPFVEQGGSGAQAANAAKFGVASGAGASRPGTASPSPQRQSGLVDSLSQVENSAIPFDDDKPIVYPDAQFWQELTTRRKKYTESDPISAKDASPPAPTSEPSASDLTGRRYVRITATPLFSQIGEVTTVNINAGKSANESVDASRATASQSTSAARSRAESNSTVAGKDDKKQLIDSSKSLTLENGTTVPGFLTRDTAGEGTFEYTKGVEERLRIPAELPPAATTEVYEPITDNPFLRVADNALSTFSVDVDTASYSNLRRFLLQNRQLPPPSAVRIEELLNYFPYQYAPPQNQNEGPFAVHTEVAACPWNGEHRLLRIGIKGREIAADRRPASNLVFLLDVSGSMDEPNKLPLVKDALRLLIQQLGENDRVAIIVYAGNSGLALPSTNGDQKTKILAALDNLQAGGSTNGGQGIQLAYDIAAGNFIKGGANRVILATDGDFNVGVTDRGDLIRLIEEKAKSGVFLTALGFGMGNLKDSTLEQLADKGNGAYGYIDNLREARKMFVEQMSGTLVTIAKDVKLQLEFNPGQVAEYRLIGYENRALKNEDFNDDKKDAGDIGAGHTVTALYELVPVGKSTVEKAAIDKAAGEQPKVDALKYSQPATLTAAAQSGELLTLKLRYKQPEGTESRLIEHSVKDDGQPYAKASVDFKFASAVALFGMLLRDSPYHGKSSFDAALELAEEGRGSDLGGYRAEFVELVRAAKQLKGGK